MRTHHDRSDRLISAAAAALTIGVDVATLVYWHTRRVGPPVATPDPNKLAYRRSDLEAWRDRLGATAELAS